MVSKYVLFIISLFFFSVNAEEVENFVDSEFANKFIEQEKTLGRIKSQTSEMVIFEKEDTSIKSSISISEYVIEMKGKPTFRTGDGSFVIDWKTLDLSRGEATKKDIDISDVEIKSFIKTKNKQIDEKSEIWIVGDTEGLAKKLDEIKLEMVNTVETQSKEDISDNNETNRTGQQVKEAPTENEGVKPNVTVEKDPQTGIATYKRMCAPRFNFQTRKGFDRIAKLEIPLSELDSRKADILSFTNSRDESNCQDGKDSDGHPPFDLEIAMGDPCLMTKTDLKKKTIDRGFRLTFNKGFSAVTSEKSYDSQGYCFYQNNEYGVDSNKSEQLYPLKTYVSGDCPIKEDWANNRIDRGFQYVIDPAKNPSGSIHPTDQNILNKCNYAAFENNKLEDDSGVKRYFDIIQEYPGESGSQSTCPVSIDTQKGVAIQTFDIVYYDHKTRKLLNSCILGTF